MTAFDHGSLAAALLGPVLQAGQVQMQHYRAGAVVARKADNSPVTEADQASEAILLAALARIAADVPVIAEEAVSAGHLPAVGRRFFLVDPLDGTREFIEGRGEFTINVALIEDGRPVFGLVYAPALSQLCVTLAADHAAEAVVAPDAEVGALEALGLRPARARQADPAALVALASRSHMTPQTRDWLARYRVASYLQAGSSLKFCVIARGEADVYPRLGPTAEWDTAAGHAVLLAAGGRVTTLDGGPLTYGKAADRFLNPHFVAWGRGEIAAHMSAAASP